MKFRKEIKEQYAYLWWWLLDQGIIVATFLVNSFFLVIWVAAMAVLYFVMKWLRGH